MTELPKVLLIEDVPIAAKLSSLLMRQLGCEVVAADTGQSGLNHLEKQKFDLILLDVGLPDMGGVEIAYKIRQPDQRNNKTPIVLLTAHSPEDFKNLLQDKIVNDCITKPLTAEIGQKLLADFNLKF